jgi:hypothetical protein
LNEFSEINKICHLKKLNEERQLRQVNNEATMPEKKQGMFSRNDLLPMKEVC